MNKYVLTCLSVFSCAFLSAQVVSTNVTVYHNYEHVHIESLKDQIVIDNTDRFKKPTVVNPRRRPNSYHGEDPDRQVEQIRQDYVGNRASIPTIINQNGTNSNSSPQDPSGAKGPNHYLQMINSEVEIFDNSGTSVLGPTSLASFIATSGNGGDPIVLYDAMADRWFVSSFGSASNSLGVGVSATSDPTGAWDFWSFSLPQFPDYPKYNVWSDGYYVSGNFGSQNTMAMDRAAMLNGDANITSIVLSLPQQGTSGFRTALPVDQDGGVIPTRPAMIIGANDANWGGGQPTDHLRIWEFAPDWATPGNSTLNILTTLNPSPFDAIFPGSGFCNIDQPGDNASLDAIGDGLMFPATWRDFGSHQSIVCCHSVDTDGNGTSGIRWYELRDFGAGWTIYQEGTYAPNDGHSRWMGSIGIDQFGHISIAYAVSSSTLSPSLRFTGRYENDPLGTMTVTECDIVTGSSTINSGCRFGDYSQMSVDPVDGITFWYTGEYFGSGRRTRIASWRLGTLAPVDLGVTNITAPVSGPLTASENLTVDVKNFGTADQTGFDITYTINGGAPITETYGGNLVVNTTDSYTFTASEDMSAYGTYTMKAWTTMAGDGFAPNDTTEITINHYPPDDVGVTALVTPTDGQLFTTTETVEVTITNFGSVSQSNFPVTMVFNGGTPVTETVTGTVPAFGTLNYTFTATVNIQPVGTHTYVLYTGLAGDFDNNNDTLNAITETSTPVYCPGNSQDCSQYADYISRVRLNNIDNTSADGPNCYDDFSAQTINVNVGVNYTLGVTVAEDNHFVTAWIDYNQDYLFTANEIVVNALSCVNQNQETTDPFTLGLATQQGTFRMRFRTIWNQGGPLDPCAEIPYGETEDYTINIGPDVTGVNDLSNIFDLSVYTNVNNSLVAVINGEADDFKVRIIDARGRLLKTTQFTHGGAIGEHILPTQYLVAGAYMVHIENTKGDRITKKFVVVR
jgi:hypothetical protein